MLGDDGKQPLPRFPEEWRGGGAEEREENTLSSLPRRNPGHGESVTLNHKRHTDGPGVPCAVSLFCFWPLPLAIWKGTVFGRQMFYV